MRYVPLKRFRPLPPPRQLTVENTPLPHPPLRCECRRGRSNRRFSHFHKGSSIGVAVTYPLCGFILERWGWPYVFYFTGVIGMVWFLAWWLFVYDTPAQHPYISQGELLHITSSLTDVVSPVKVMRARYRFADTSRSLDGIRQTTRA